MISYNDPLMAFDPYQVLEIDAQADADTIKSAWRKMNMRWHPDRVEPRKKAWAQQQFHRVQTAYALLSDPAQRRRYDASVLTRSRAMTPDDFFDALRRGVAKKSSPPSPATSASIIVRSAVVRVPLDIAFKGGEVELVDAMGLKVGVPVPAGCVRGERVVVKKTIRGKAYEWRVQLEVEPHGINASKDPVRFWLDGPHLHAILALSMPRACLGGDQDFVHLDGKVLEVTIPEGLESGAILRCAEKGWFRRPGSDVFLHVHVMTPTNLNAQQRRSMGSLLKSLDGKKNQHPQKGAVAAGVGVLAAWVKKWVPGGK